MRLFSCPLAPLMDQKPLASLEKTGKRLRQRQLHPFNCRFVIRFLGCFGPEVQMVAASAALEAPKFLAAEVGRKRLVFSLFRGIMERAFSSNLLPRALGGNEAQQLENFRHGELVSQFAKVNRRHGSPQRTEKRNP